MILINVGTPAIEQNDVKTISVFCMPKDDVIEI